MNGYPENISINKHTWTKGFTYRLQGLDELLFLALNVLLFFLELDFRAIKLLKLLCNEFHFLAQILRILDLCQLSNVHALHWILFRVTCKWFQVSWPRQQAVRIAPFPPRSEQSVPSINSLLIMFVYKHIWLWSIHSIVSVQSLVRRIRTRAVGRAGCVFELARSPSERIPESLLFWTIQRS